MQKIRLMVMAIMGLMIAGSGNAQDSTHYFTLQQALEYGQQHNVQVKNALLDVNLQEQVNREVTGNALPQINGRAGVTDNVKIPKMFFPKGMDNFFGEKDAPPLAKDTYISNLFSAPWSGMAGVALSQLLFDGQVFTGLQARKTLIDYKKKASEVTFEQIRLNIAKIYYQLVVSKTQIALIDSNLALVQKNRNDTKIMYDNGFAEKLDIDKLDVQLANLRSQRNQVSNSVTNGYLGLKVLMGMPVKEELVLTDELTDEKLKEGIIEAVTEFDYSQRKDFQAALLGEKLGALDVQRYRYSKIPTVSLSGSWDYMTQTNKMAKMFNGTAEWYPVSAISLNINIPIFNGFATNARIAQAKIKLQQTQNQISALKLTIDQERESSVNTFKSAITDMDYQKQNMKLAENVYQQTKKKYEMGTGSQIEIDNARVQLQSAQTNYYNALYNAVVAKVDFLKAIGKF
ncbi:TolC family protein [Niabella drilacis]|uniref:Outer membrane protein TolC n=1 Tax=Niabella drilacis (strain DSM 25811 / CCM 8410 / CCUG 62505 / LMG 26954 / E90) TaxID=1285928 RepID=A0A1G6SB73_NIADE|nr:TolC family protein [Niabella drilacis]SDD13377.1 Outer membrane protein TolC [Niabella drilacis]